jgi:hypothetical protein
MQKKRTMISHPKILGTILAVGLLTLANISVLDCQTNIADIDYLLINAL